MCVRWSSFQPADIKRNGQTLSYIKINANELNFQSVSPEFNTPIYLLPLNDGNTTIFILKADNLNSLMSSKNIKFYEAIQNIFNVSPCFP